MTQTRWGDNLLLSVPQMDSEHRELIAQADEFSAAMERGASRAELEVRLSQLIDGFLSHFKSEESMMRTNRFPGLEVHAAEHRRLIGQMSGLRDDLGAGNVKLCDALGEFVRLWTEQHIIGPDASFAQFLHKGKAPCGPGLLSIG